MNVNASLNNYFPFAIQLRSVLWEKLELQAVAQNIRSNGHPPILFFRELADRSNRLLSPKHPLQAGMLSLYSLQKKIFQYLLEKYASEQCPGIIRKGLDQAGFPCGSPELLKIADRFCTLFPGQEQLFAGIAPSIWLTASGVDAERQQQVVKELLMLRLAGENRALDQFRDLLDDQELAVSSSYPRLVARLEAQLSAGPPVGSFGVSLPELLRLPLKAAPGSLYDQMEYIRQHWQEVVPPQFLVELQTVFSVLKEEWSIFAPRAEPGGCDVLEFGKGLAGLGEAYGAATNDYYPEPERFSPDTDWMPNVVLLAKMVYVWLGQLSAQYSLEITQLDQIPDAELDRLARWGITGLWLIGLWERSPASQKIKQLCGNPEAISSAYSLFDYTIAHDLGGEPALWNLRDRALKRGIRLASDMVPNHTGIYSRWTVEHPDWFVQLDYPPYPAYQFNGPDLSSSPEISINIEDGYWERRDAAVVFKHYDHRDGRTRYIYHGNDGSSTPWNDTAQLDYLNPEVRETVIRTILHVARMFPIIRFDAAMTLAKKHFQRLWFPQPGHGGIPSRPEHGLTREAFDAAMPEEFWREVVDRVAAEASDTLLLAEAFWLMEGYFVRTLGMHRVYNSAFMNMLKMEENAKYRQTIKNVLEFNPQVLQRFVNFMNNPDEKTAVEQFGKENKYFGACVLLVTMPGLPMIGHGQVEGFHEKYGMEYKKAYWSEPVDEHLVKAHERLVFPLMRRRWLFSGADNFVFYDFWVGSSVNEEVFAYSNRAGDQLAIILYHNKFASTAGWIKTSTSFAVKNSDGEMDLRQTELADSLGFKGDGRHYYVFRDYASGLEYIRNGRELCEKGLFVELEAYEFHAFLDFREIWDDDYGTWGRLCHQLNGQPAPSMDEEVKQIRFADLMDLLRNLLDQHSGLLAGEYRELSKDGLQQVRKEFAVGLKEFYRLLAQKAELVSSAEPALAAVVKELSCLEAEADNFGPVLQGRTARLLAFAWLVLHRTGELAATDETAAATVTLVHRYGLVRPLAEELFSEATDDTDQLASLAVPAVLQLFDAMLLWQRSLSLPEKDRAALLPELILDRHVSAFIGRHSSGGHEWFVKERWELLISWLVITAMVSESGESKTGRIAAARIKALKAAGEGMVSLAAAAGYQVDTLVSCKEAGRCR